MTAQFLEELAGQLEQAAARLEQGGNPFEKAWSRHLAVDRLQVLRLSMTWRELAEAGET